MTKLVALRGKKLQFATAVIGFILVIISINDILSKGENVFYIVHIEQKLRTYIFLKYTTRGNST